MRQKSRSFVGALAAMLVFGLAGGANAFPTKAITVYCPWAAGGSTDLTIRMLANRASEILGQPVVVMNATGGSGFVANTQVYNAAPDGYTLVVNASSTMTAAPHLRQASFDARKMTPIMSYGVYPFTVAVKTDAPWKDMKEFIDYMKKNPGKVTLSTSGPDAMESIAINMLKDQEKLDFRLVPFEGGAPAVASTLGGHTSGFIGVAEAIPYIRDGSMRGLATFLSKRMPGLSDIPTLKELGYDVVVESRLAIYGPPGIPKDVAKTLQDAFHKAMEDEGFKKSASTFEITPDFLDSERLGQYDRDLSAKIKAVLIKIGRIKE